MFLMSCCLVNSKQTFDKRLGCHSVRIRSGPCFADDLERCSIDEFEQRLKMDTDKLEKLVRKIHSLKHYKNFTLPWLAFCIALIQDRSQNQEPSQNQIKSLSLDSKEGHGH
jgi:hypothetical protein